MRLTIPIAPLYPLSPSDFVPVSSSALHLMNMVKSVQFSLNSLKARKKHSSSHNFRKP